MYSLASPRLQILPAHAWQAERRSDWQRHIVPASCKDLVGAEKQLTVRRKQLGESEITSFTAWAGCTTTHVIYSKPVRGVNIHLEYCYIPFSRETYGCSPSFPLSNASYASHSRKNIRHASVCSSLVFSTFSIFTSSLSTPFATSTFVSAVAGT
jgi:hypothetical protein